MIDFHCHLDLYKDPAAIVAECTARGLYVLSVTTTPSAWKGTSALADSSPRIRTALGLHPQVAHQRERELEGFSRYFHLTSYVGEIGLDGAPEFAPHLAVQKRVFETILRRCETGGGRILSIHSRRAANLVLNELERFPGAGLPVLHWFSGTKKELARAVALGCWFSVGPAMMAGRTGASLVEMMPRDRVLTESDGPFAQVSGRAALPWDCATAVPGIATAWRVSIDDVNATLRRNLESIGRAAQEIAGRLKDAEASR
jgi:TatD DNase family protein